MTFARGLFAACCAVTVVVITTLLRPGVRATPPNPVGTGSGSFESGRVSFSLQIEDLVIPYRQFTYPVMPGHTIGIALNGTGEPSSVAWEYSGGILDRGEPGTVRWTAPRESGRYTLTASSGGESIRLNLMVLVPAERLRDNRLNGYPIGTYPDGRSQPIYRGPSGFIEVTPSLVDLRVSPHFRLDSFLCKQHHGFPKYVVLRPLLLLKLEYLLQQVNRRGVPARGFSFVSGYRTPYYNEMIGNVPYSRHLWGGAADIYVDVQPRDGRMDDLNEDGTVDWRDARWLRRLVRTQQNKPEYEPLRGGLGIYGNTANHGPFVHVDVRGNRARWNGSSVPR